MRIFKISLLVILLILGIYLLVMSFFVDESKSFSFEKEINYPIEKVYPQFNNFQNFARWYHYFSDSKTMRVDYYKPYSGEGSSMSFEDKKNRKIGEIYIRYEHPYKTLKYLLFEGKNNNPTSIKIKFIALSKEKTKMIWQVDSPKKTLLKRVSNIWAEDSFIENVDKSMVNLKNILGNKVEKDQFLTNITYDSLMVEEQPEQLVIGINVTTSNKKDALFKSIEMNNNKLYAFITNDLGKKEDEFGFPVLINSPNNYKDKEVSYFLGIPISKKVEITDNSFSYKTLANSKVYSMYFKGNFANRIRPIQQLMQKAKRDSMHNGEIQQVFLEAPKSGKEVLMKFSLPVSK